MKKKYLLYALAIILYSCNTEDDLSSEQFYTTAKLTISTEIVTTRAFSTGLKNDVEFQEGNAIGLWLFDKDGKYYSLYTNETARNRKATFSGTIWNIEEEMALTEVPAKVVAYYPYQDFSFSESRTTVHTDLIAYQISKIDIASNPQNGGQQDYLWGESADSVSSLHPNARIQFKHVLPRITFVVEDGEDSANTITFRNAILKNSTDNGNTICTTGYLYSNGSTAKSSETGQSITNRFTQRGESIQFDFLVFPTEVAEGSVILRIETMQPTGTYIFHDINIPSTKWEGGKQYTYFVSVSENYYSQGNLTVGGTIATAVDLGLSVKWADHNMGASTETQSGGTYYWGDTTGKASNTPSAALSYSNICGTQYDIATYQWGTPWRLPNFTEVRELMRNTTATEVTRSGVKGVLLTSTKPGYTNRSIFFPYYGQYSNTGEYFFDSWTGIFGGTYVKLLNITAGKVKDDVVSKVDYRSRVRPVSD